MNESHKIQGERRQGEVRKTQEKPVLSGWGGGVRINTSALTHFLSYGNVTSVISPVSANYR